MDSEMKMVTTNYIWLFHQWQIIRLFVISIRSNSSFQCNVNCLLIDLESAYIWIIKISCMAQSETICLRNSNKYVKGVSINFDERNTQYVPNVVSVSGLSILWLPHMFIYINHQFSRIKKWNERHIALWEQLQNLTAKNS